MRQKHLSSPLFVLISHDMWEGILCERFCVDYHFESMSDYTIEVTVIITVSLSTRRVGARHPLNCNFWPRSTPKIAQLRQHRAKQFGNISLAYKWIARISFKNKGLKTNVKRAYYIHQFYNTRIGNPLFILPSLKTLHSLVCT